MNKPSYEELEQERLRLIARVSKLEESLKDAVLLMNAIPDGILIGEVESFKLQCILSLTSTPRIDTDELKMEWNCPTIENGKNRYGLDVAYFRNLFNRELNRTLQDYRPAELARNLLRMARTADISVFAEPEFTGALKVQWQAEALESIADEAAQNDPYTGENSDVWTTVTVRYLRRTAAKLRQRTQEASDGSST